MSDEQRAPEAMGDRSKVEFEAHVAAAIERAVGAASAAPTEPGGPVQQRLERLRRFGLLEPGDAFPDVGPRFAIETRLGRGGMGVVYRAHDRQLGRDVALKFLPAMRLGDEPSRRRFLREAQAAAQLRHPGVVTLLEVVPYGEGFFQVLELVAGCTLAELLRGLQARVPVAVDVQRDDLLTGWGSAVRGSLEAPRTDARSYTEFVLRVVRDVALALQHVHDQGLVHRDIKPSNIMLGPNGRAQIVDFGLSAVAEQRDITHSGEFVGTRAYAAPEQLRGHVVDARADVYSLGVTLYELLTWRVPYDGQSAADLLQQIEAAPPLRPRAVHPRLPRDVEVVCLAALAPRVEQRLRSAAQLAEELRRILEYEPITVRPPGVTVRALQAVRRHPWHTALATTLLAAAVGYGVAAWQRAQDARAEAAWREHARSAARAACMEVEQAIRGHGIDDARSAALLGVAAARVAAFPVELDADDAEVARLRRQLRGFTAQRRLVDELTGPLLASSLRSPQFTRRAVAQLQSVLRDAGFDWRGHDDRAARERFATAVRASPLRGFVRLALTQLKRKLDELEQKDDAAELRKLLWFCYAGEPALQTCYVFPPRKEQQGAALEAVDWTHLDAAELSSLALSYVPLDQPERAATLLEAARLRDPGRLLLLTSLGEVYRARAPSAEVLFATRRAAIDLAPAHPASWIGWARDMAMTYGAGSATPCFAECVRRFPEEALAHYWQADNWIAQGEMTLARAALAQALRLDPQLADVHFRLADLEPADSGARLAAYRACLALDPTRTDVCLAAHAVLTTGQRAGEALAVVWPALRWHHASAGMPDLVLRAVASALEVGAHVEAALLLDFLAEVLPSLPPGLHETAAALRSRVAAAADTAARLADLRGATPEWRALGAMPRLRAAFAGADVAPDVARERRVAACRELRGALVDLRVRAQADPQAALAVNLALRRWLADASWQQALRPVYNADIRSEELDAAGREFITTWREMKVLRDQTAVVFAAAPR